MMSRRIPFLLCLAALSPSAMAKPAFLALFEKTENPPTRIDRCFLCHRVEGQPMLNAYGQAVRVAGISAQGFESTLAGDADGDGVSNGDEIKAGTLPGNPDDHPGALVDLPDSPFAKKNAGGTTGASGPTANPAKINVIPSQPYKGTKTDVLTYANDDLRTGWNSKESQLSAKTVSKDTFGKLWYRPLNGQVYAQPLLVSDLNLPGKGSHDVVYAATLKNEVFALDAATGDLLWSRRVDAPVPRSENIYGQGWDVTSDQGILSTPVIDRKANAIYVVAYCKDLKPKQNPEGHVFKAFALSLTTGEVLPDWPRLIEGTANGPQGKYGFDGHLQLNRVGLALRDNRLYVAFAAQGDMSLGEPPPQTYHGWVFSINTQKPQDPLGVYNDSPNSTGGGIWMGGTALGIDDKGDLYFSTGNAVFDLDTGGPNAGDTILKLGASGGNLAFSGKATDYFTPEDQEALNGRDADVAACGIMLLPNQSKAKTPHLLLAGSKAGTMWLLDRDDMSGYSPASNKKPLMEFYPGDWYVKPAYWETGGDHFVVFAPRGNAPTAYRVTTDESGVVGLRRAWQSKKVPYQAGAPIVSSDGNKEGTAILWITDTHKTPGSGDEEQRLGPAALLGFNAATGDVLFDSETYAALDRLSVDQGRKFSSPTVANGHVFVGTDGITAYGLLPEPSGPPAAPELTAPADSAGANGTRPTFQWKGGGAPRYYLLTVAADPDMKQVIEKTAVTTETAQIKKTLNPGTTYYWTVQAFNRLGSAKSAKVFSFTTPKN